MQSLYFRPYRTSTTPKVNTDKGKKSNQNIILFETVEHSVTRNDKYKYSGVIKDIVYREIGLVMSLLVKSA